MRKHTGRRIIAALLSAVMVLTSAPMPVNAAEAAAADTAMEESTETLAEKETSEEPAVEEGTLSADKEESGGDEEESDTAQMNEERSTDESNTDEGSTDNAETDILASEEQSSGEEFTVEALEGEEPQTDTEEISGDETDVRAASEHTRDEAVAWVKAQHGKAYSGSYGVQCVDLIVAYYNYLGEQRVWGNACDYTTNTQPAGMTRINYYDGFVAEPGDIVVWNKNDRVEGAQYGHIGIVVSADINGFTSAEQNYGGNNEACKTDLWRANYSFWVYGKIACVIRPNFKSSVPPPPPFDRVKGEYMEKGYYRTIPDGYYHIASSFGDKWWLVIAGMSNDNGANVELWDYSIRDFECDEQLFYFQFINAGGGRGFYKITNKKSGKCLDVAGASEYMYDENGNPTNVQQYEDNGGANQQWAVNWINGGDKGILYTFQARCSGLYLDLWQGENSLYNGANISMCYGNRTAAQQWRLVPYAPSIGKTIEDGEYQITNILADDKAVGATGTVRGANVELNASYKGDYKHTFDVKYLGNGYYSIINKYSGLSLDVADLSRATGTNVQLCDYGGNDAQKWIIKPCGDGSYNVISKCNGLYINLPLGAKDGSNVSMEMFNKSLNEQWKFVPYEKPKFAQPTASIPSGTEVEKGTKLVLICLGADHIYYTADGTQPTRNSAEYPLQTGIIINTDMTVKTFAVKEGCQDSDVAVFTYTVKQNVPEESESPSDEESSADKESSSSEESSSNEESSSDKESSDKESSATEESSAPGDTSNDGEDIEDGVKWHYNEKKVTYKDLSKSGARIAADIKPKVYDGTPYKPAVKVTAVENGRTVTLTEGTDYRVIYTNNIHAGTGKVTVKGNGIYKGEISREFQITKKPCKKLKIVTGGMTAGSKSEPKVYVYDGGTLLKKDKDYTLEGVGAELAAAKGRKTIYVTAAADSDYEGTAAASITVYAADSSRIKGILDNPDSVKLPQSTYTYTGKPCRPAVTVTAGGHTLEPNKDYTVKYQNNTNAGTAFLTVTGKGAYAGSIVKEFTITSAGGGFALKNPIKPVTYNGRLQKPKAVITSGGKTLKLNKDYTVSYSSNLHATDRAKIIVRGKGNYANMPAKVFYFSIIPQNISKASVKGKQGSLVLTYANHTLVQGADYDIVYGETDKGKIAVTIKAVEGSSFAGEVTKRISQKK